MKIPVFHDDQHGTAIIVGAAVLNGLQRGRQEDRRGQAGHARGAGAAALACLDLLVELGVKRENIWVTDIKGVVYAGRDEDDGPDQGALRQERPTARTLAEVIAGADVFLGLSGRRRAEAGDGRRRWRATR